MVTPVWLSSPKYLLIFLLSATKHTSSHVFTSYGAKCLDFKKERKNVSWDALAGLHVSDQLWPSARRESGQSSMQKDILIMLFSHSVLTE